MKQRILRIALITIAAAPASTGLAATTVGVNTMALHVTNSGNQNSAFPSICQTPAAPRPVAIPYPALTRSGAAKPTVDAKTATQGTKDSGIEIAAVTINEQSIMPAVVNTDAVLDALLRDVPAIPSTCSGLVAERYWDSFELWSATVYEVMTLVHDLALAANLKAASSFTPQAYRSASLVATASTRAAHEVLNKSLLSSIAACSTGNVETISSTLGRAGNGHRNLSTFITTVQTAYLNSIVNVRP